MFNSQAFQKIAATLLLSSFSVVGFPSIAQAVEPFFGAKLSPNSLNDTWISPFSGTVNIFPEIVASNNAEFNVDIAVNGQSILEEPITNFNAALSTGFNIEVEVGTEVSFTASHNQGSFDLSAGIFPAAGLIFTGAELPPDSFYTDPFYHHVGLFFEGTVYESTPGYIPGEYQDLFTNESVTIGFDYGVQDQHTLGTFASNDPIHAHTIISDHIPESISDIDKDAQTMQEFAIGQLGAGYTDDVALNRPPTPNEAKGYTGNSFTSAGLIERLAEDANIKDGWGFIPSLNEADPDDSLFSADFFQTEFMSVETIISNGTGNCSALIPTCINATFQLADPYEVSTISPNNLHFWSTGGQAGNWLAGSLKDIDFILTDPQKRRLGYKDGTSFREIPGAKYTGTRTDIATSWEEDFFIPFRLPGAYQLEIFGRSPNSSCTVGGPEYGVICYPGDDELDGNPDTPDINDPVIIPPIDGPEPEPVPEPSSLLTLLTLGLGFLKFSQSRRTSR